MATTADICTVDFQIVLDLSLNTQSKATIRTIAIVPIAHVKISQRHSISISSMERRLGWPLGFLDGIITGLGGTFWGPRPAACSAGPDTGRFGTLTEGVALIVLVCLFCLEGMLDVADWILAGFTESDAKAVLLVAGNGPRAPLRVV